MKKKDKYKYNYAFLFYDVNVLRVTKVFKICKKYLSHFQRSVFRGDITPSNLMLLKNELRNVVVDDEDFVCIIKLKNNNVYGEDILGNPQNQTGEDLII